jgi:hypothetical protein
MNSLLESDFPVAKDAYVSFDGLTIKEKIRQRLNQTNIFTDQNFEGSNLAAFNDAVAMVFSLFLYNLNKNISEKQFTEAQIYENINRIVKDIDYKPLGYQSANVSYSLSVSNLNAGIYTIPRYTNLSVGGIKYSFAEDVSFTKTTDNTSETINTNNILYQGQYFEFPQFTSTGLENEIIFLTSTDTDLIDHFHIDVYVKSGSGKWEKYKQTQSLFLNNANQKVYELRFNENKRYEIKFGNGINGKKLNAGDLVSIFYLKSDGELGEIGANVLSSGRLNTINTNTISQILSDTGNTYLTSSQFGNNIIIDNSCGSSFFSQPESVAEIKQNAPGLFRSQYRLVTSNDYETFIRTNFANILQDVKVINNSEYIDSYIQYFYDLGLTKPQLESRALFNQVQMADSCNFNNVYVIAVPKTVNNKLSYIYPAQKSLIVETIKEEKVLTSETVIIDPVYIAVDIAVSDTNTTQLDDIPVSQILIKKNPFSRRSDISIKQEIALLIENTFSRKTGKLGALIDINQLSANILGIEDVKGIYTKRSDSSLVVEGLRFIMFNPIYGDTSAQTVIGNKQLEIFQFAYLFDENIINKIVIE